MGAMAQDQARAFRDALGAFATGVTIVTTQGRDGRPVGVTASSFNAVSLDPPLVLWSLARSAKSHDDFCASDHFAIHVLAAHQDALSNRFARSGEDKFDGVEWRPGEGGVPILADHAAVFECRTRHRYDGGDHVILVGEVMTFARSDHAPLLFHAGRYAETRARPAAPGGATVDLDAASFTDDFLLYLLGRAHYQAVRPSRERIARMGLGEAEYAVFGRLSMGEPMTASELVRQMDHTGLGIDAGLVARMRDDGLIDGPSGSLRMTDHGKQIFLEALSIAKAREEDLLAGFTPGESADLKRLLRKMIEVSGPDVPIAWRS